MSQLRHSRGRPGCAVGGVPGVGAEGVAVTDPTVETEGLFSFTTDSALIEDARAAIFGAGLQGQPKHYF